MKYFVKSLGVYLILCGAGIFFEINLWAILICFNAGIFSNEFF